MIRIRLFAAAALAVASLLAGCAATVTTAGGSQPPLAVPAASQRTTVLFITGDDKATKSQDWEALKGEWRGAMKTAGEAAGMTVKFQDMPPSPSNEDGTVVVVRVNDYRYLTSGARYGLGIMTGNAFMDAQVEFIDLRSGKRFGERRYNTSSSAWQGVFSAMTDKQLAAISTQITNEIKRR